jgi:hypothetical protein
MVVKCCGICDKEFEATKIHKKYCSKECAKTAVRRYHARLMRAKYKKRKCVEKVCVICGDFYVCGEVKAQTQKSCSTDCSNALRRIRQLKTRSIRCQRQRNLRHKKAIALKLLAKLTNTERVSKVPEKVRNRKNENQRRRMEDPIKRQKAIERTRAWAAKNAFVRTREREKSANAAYRALQFLETGVTL